MVDYLVYRLVLTCSVTRRVSCGGLSDIRVLQVTIGRCRLCALVQGCETKSVSRTTLWTIVCALLQGCKT